ncbi:MAG: hypothetical protein ACRDPH_01920 [Marmoricola sp.]
MADRTSEHPEEPERATEAPETDVLESDASGNGPEGLAGDMGLSSERTGEMRGNREPGTHGADRSSGPDTDRDDVPPEQSADPATGAEPHPANDLPEHEFDPDTWSGHSHG